MKKAINNLFEIKFARVCLVATIFMFIGLFHYLAKTAYHAHHAGHTRLFLETLLFATAMFFVAYGNLLYQICLIGYYKRREANIPTDRDTLEQVYLQAKPARLTTIIPAYKEERSVNWQTMISAALAEYPTKNVVLLIDDPYYATALPDVIRLEDTRRIPHELQALFDAPARHFRSLKAEFEARTQAGSLNLSDELTRLANHYDYVANWLHDVAASLINKGDISTLPHADRFFVETVLYTPAREHADRAAALRELAQGAANDATVNNHFLARHYARLVGIFTVNFSSFERKKYTNLSHEANKAMNLNNYMALIGKSWKEVEMPDGKWHLYETSRELADFTIADADYVNTIDSDSLMTSDYALRLIEIMERPENSNLAVIQSPCSSFQGCPKGLERTAGACIDIQFLTHQGYTHWGASFWVGANAMLRRKALEEIKEVRKDGDKLVSIYIQDRTVIEDTESTIDLVHKGWRLYNYPERMTFSATPPDFGSLLIQRRRWSNGGLLILPKLFRYVINSPKNLGLAKELFMRFHYLASTTTGCVATLLLLLYPFGNMFGSPFLLLSVVPFFFLHIRDLRNSGYRASDALRICAMNIMLLPIVTGGVLKSIQQIITGKKIPFGRTPKIPGRTAAPALYSAIEVLMLVAFVASGTHQAMLHHWSRTIFCFINAAFVAYALLHFVGVKAAFEDIFGGLISRWRAAFHKAEVITMVPNQNSSIPAMSASQNA